MKIDDYYTTTAAGQREKITSADWYDANQAVLSHHWQDVLWNEQQILSTEKRCNARSLLLESVIWYSTFLEIPPLTKLAAHYNLEFYELKVLGRVHRLLDKEPFPRLKTLFQVALTIPVTSCSCERSFSCLRRVKTWLRTRMTQERLDDLAVLAIERGPPHGGNIPTRRVLTTSWWLPSTAWRKEEYKCDVCLLTIIIMTNWLLKINRDSTRSLCVTHTNLMLICNIHYIRLFLLTHKASW